MALEIKTEACKAMVEALKDKGKVIWEMFALCLEEPRGSTNMQGISDKIVAICKELGYEAIRDEALNIVVRKPAHPDYKDAPSVCVQCHIDMVCQKNDETKHDFLKDPIVPRIDGEYVKATGTSLGADNGMGMASCLAILADKEMKHGPIECLFTVDEEIGMIGASKMKPGFLQSKYLINGDSEDEYKICVGCAGGMQTEFFAPITRTAAPDLKRVALTLEGFAGGHTGVDCDKHRASALKVMVRMLKAAEKLGPQLVCLKGGGPSNAITRAMNVEVAIAADKAAEFRAVCDDILAKVAHEHRTVEKGLRLVDAEESKMDPMSVEETRKVVDFMHLLPFGPLRFSPAVEGLVETSYAVTTVEAREKEVWIMGSARSSVESQMKLLDSQLESLVTLAGFGEIKRSSIYPGWEPVLDSKLLQVTKAAHVELFKKEPEVYAVHAGLECGQIMSQYPGMEAISIGPEIHNPHSPDEEVLIDSVPRFWEFLSKVLSELK